MTDATGRPRRRPLDVLTSPTTLVLLGAYLALCALYAWQATRRATPTIFTDEIELTQLSRAIADTGHAALRGGAPPHSFAGLTAYLIAPWWWIDDVGTAYAAIKLTGVAVMTAVIFPTYLLGRLVLPPWWAIAAAVGATATPALAYSPFLVKEPLAYPLATLALLLAVRAVARPSIGRWGLAVAAAAAGWLARSQLAVLFFVLALAALFLVWDSARFRAWRTTWTRGDWVGAGALLFGAVVVANAVIAHKSLSWYTTTAFFKGRLVDYAVWALAAFGIGIGLLPVIAGVASLARRPDRWTREERAFAVVTGAALLAFVFYAGVKGAYLSTVFANLIVERNLIYLGPLLFVGTGLFLARRDTPVWATVAAGAAVLYLVVSSPYSLANYPNYEAHGLAVAAFANRIFHWPDATIQLAFVIVVVASVGLLVAVRLARARPAARALACVLGSLAIAWTLAAEIYAAHGERIASDREYSTLPKPADWLDRTIAPGKAVFLGQQIADTNPLHQLEFWNRSLEGLWSLDATAPGPGAVITPDLATAGGTLDTRPGFGAGYVVAGPGVDLANRQVGPPVGTYRIYATDANGDIRLTTAQSGVYPDGWMSSGAQFTKYHVPPGSNLLARVTLSREAWCGTDVPGHIRIRLGPIIVGPDRQARMSRVTARAHGTIRHCQRKVFVLRTPPRPWRVEVEISPTFSPHTLDPTQGDARQLGAKVDFGVIPLPSR